MELHETAFVLDSTKIQSYQTCPRRFWFEYVLGWRPDPPSIHLFFGECWHLSMEHFLKNKISKQTAAEACLVFEEKWRTRISIFDEELCGNKNLANASRALYLYALAYANEAPFRVLKTEVSGKIPVNANNLSRSIYFKIDAICQSDELGYYVLEHKTASFFDRNYEDQFKMLTQTDTYTYALHWFYGDKGPIFGVVINAMTIKNEPRLKKDGSLYANSTDCEARRFYIAKSPTYLESWLTDINSQFDEIERDFSKLSSAKAADNTMDCFNRRTVNCVTKYGICPFHTLCLAWNNPLQHEEPVQPGFIKEFWDPRTRGKDEKVKDMMEETYGSL